METSFNEAFVIHVFRNFDFLRPLGFSAAQVAIHGRDPVVVFENKALKRRISISWEGAMLVELECSDFWGGTKFLLSEYIQASENSPTSAAFEDQIAFNAEFLRNHFSELLRGKSWRKEVKPLSKSF